MTNLIKLAVPGITPPNPPKALARVPPEGKGGKGGFEQRNSRASGLTDKERPVATQGRHFETPFRLGLHSRAAHIGRSGDDGVHSNMGLGIRARGRGS